jgi:nicotinamidase-related amidase
MDPMKTALLIIDMQNGVIAKALNREKVIANIQGLIEKARAQKVPVIWVRHSADDMPLNSHGWEIVPELKPLPSEIKIQKIYGDSFEATNLKVELKKLDVDRLLITGAQTEACIRSTLHGAFVRGYNTVLVSDAHTTEDLSEYGLPKPEVLISFTNIYWKWQAGPGREASVEKAEQVQF